MFRAKREIGYEFDLETHATVTNSRPSGSYLTVNSIDVYYGDIQVLWNISLGVGKGSIVSLIGSNGAGKTTTLKTMAGIIKPKRGEIWFDGQLISKMSTQKIVELGIVYVPEGRGLFPDMSVEENLIMGSYNRNARKSRDSLIKRVYEIFPILKERRNQHASSLSGGEAQMLAIARGLMSKPKILMLDEPSSGLAPNVVDKIFKAITELRNEGITILLVEQDAGRALQVSDQAYVLETGKVTLAGTGKELLENKFVREAYLGM
jgi:branched-chain amino acid transport system ATP-binding protein